MAVGSLTKGSECGDMVMKELVKEELSWNVQPCCDSALVDSMFVFKRKVQRFQRTKDERISTGFRCVALCVKCSKIM